jgi:hypothetical protein
MRRGVVVVVVLVAVVLASCVNAAVVEIHADAVHGLDSNGGTSAADAVATLHRAVALVAASPFRTRGGAIVHVHAGTYAPFFNITTLTISAALLPNTSALWPVVFARVAGEARPVLTGGIQLPKSSFRVADAVSDAAVWPRVDPAARGSLMVADLASAGGVSELG